MFQLFDNKWDKVGMPDAMKVRPYIRVTPLSTIVSSVVKDIVEDSLDDGVWDLVWSETYVQTHPER